MNGLLNLGDITEVEMETFLILSGWVETWTVNNWLPAAAPKKVKLWDCGDGIGHITEWAYWLAIVGRDDEQD